MEKSELKPLEKQIAHLTLLFEKSHKTYLKCFNDISKRFNDVNQRFDDVDRRFDDMELSFERRMKQWEQKFEKHTQATESRFTNLLNICTALRSDMGSLRNEWSLFLKRQEERDLEGRVRVLEITVKGIENRLGADNL